MVPFLVQTPSSSFTSVERNHSFFCSVWHDYDNSGTARLYFLQVLCLKGQALIGTLCLLALVCLHSQLLNVGDTRRRPKEIAITPFSLCFLQFHRNITYSIIIFIPITLWMGPDRYPLYSRSQHLFMSNEDSPLSVCSPFPESLVCYIYYPETLALLKEHEENSMSAHLSGNGSVFPDIFCLDSGLVRFLRHTIMSMFCMGKRSFDRSCW